MKNDIEYIITRGAVCDIESIVQFQADMAMESEGCVLDKEKVTKGVTSAILDDSKGVYWVAKFEKRPIGSLMLTREWSDWNNEWYWWIQSVYVGPLHRGKGVYRAMYERVKQMARNENVSQVRLYVDKTNNTAQHAYQHLGMTETHYLMYEEVIFHI